MTAAQWKNFVRCDAGQTSMGRNQGVIDMAEFVYLYRGGERPQSPAQ